VGEVVGGAILIVSSTSIAIDGNPAILANGAAGSSGGPGGGSGGITEAGNIHARRLLAEAGWHYRGPSGCPPRLGKALTRRSQGQPPAVLAQAWQALSIKSAPGDHRRPQGADGVGDQRPAEGFRHPDLCHSHPGGVLSSHPSAESPRRQVPPPTDRATPISQARLAGLTRAADVPPWPAGARAAHGVGAVARGDGEGDVDCNVPYYC
jgi:hypothetical protein